jgi:hypothetical protein
MVTAGHFTAPVKALGAMPPSVRAFASFSPTDVKDPKTWIPVVRMATHPSMPPCPPPPQCDPTDDILVTPLEPGIADVGLVFLEHAPNGIQPARLADHGALERAEGAPTTIVGFGTTVPRKPPPNDHLGWKAHIERRCASGGRTGHFGHAQLRLLGRLRWWDILSDHQTRTAVMTSWLPT